MVCLRLGRRVVRNRFKLRPLRTVPRFALNASELAPLSALAGNRATDAQRRIAVSGTVSWDQSISAIKAHVVLKSGGAKVGTLDIGWDDAKINAIASVTGKMQGATLNVQRIAP